MLDHFWEYNLPTCSIHLFPSPRYDHLVDLVHKILSQKPPDVVDNLEQYSWEVKQEKFRPNFDLLNDVYLSPKQLTIVRRQDEMFRVCVLCCACWLKTSSTC